MQTRPREGLRGTTLRAGRRRSLHPDPWAALCRQDSLVQTPWVRLQLGLFLLSSGLWPLSHCPQNACLCSAGSRRPLVYTVDVDFIFLIFSFLFEILFAFAGLDSGKLSHSSDRSCGSGRGGYSTSSYPHQYCRSGVWAAGAGRVDNPYSSRGCPPWTGRCFSYRGSLQATVSWAPR